MFQITKKLAREVAAAIARRKFEQVGDGRIFVPNAKVFIGGVFAHRHAPAGGEYGPVQFDPNLVVNQGLNYVLNAAFLGQAQTTQFYVALFSNNYNPAAGLTGANFNATADEFVAYEAADRPEWDIGAAPTTNQTVSNTGNEAEFVYSAGGPYNIYGAAVLSGATKEGGADMCIAATRFASPRTNQLAGDRLAIGYSLVGQDAS